MSLHLQSSFVTCDICGKKYKKIGSLNRHLKNHTGIKPYKCNLCGDSFTLKDFLAVHMVTHYDGKLLAHTKKRKATKISGRTRKFQQIEEIDQKPASVQTSKSVQKRSADKKFPCPQCSLIFTRKDNLNVHMSNHMKTIAFNCASCFFESYSQSLMIAHVAAHADFQAYTMNEVVYKPFKCTKCSARFSRNGGLLTHRRVHEKVKRFACELCDYQSSWVTRMKLHAITHLKK